MPGGAFGERLLRHASRMPDRPALIHAGDEIPYGALAGRVQALARSLAARAIGPGALVALTARREIDHVLATLALMELGVPQLALASRDPPALRANLASRVGATIVLADRPDDAVPGLPWIELGPALVEARMTPRAGGASPPSLPDADAAALYLTGSGTTGDPKIVAYSQRDLGTQADAHLDFTRHRILRPAHVEFNNSKRQRLYALWQGATCVFADAGAGSLRAQTSRDRVNWLELSPLHAADLVVACRAEGPLDDGVGIRIGGSRAPWPLRRDLIATVSPRLYVSYGTTETAFVSIADPSMHDERESVGPPSPNVAVEILDAAGAPVPAGDVGEIRIRAPAMATRYVGDAAATAQHFRDGWFRPGDLASRSHDGTLVLHGRADDMMILNGVNIFPAEIERVLEAHPAVESAAAFPIASQAHGEIPAAAVELRPGHDCGPGEIAAWARARLGLRAPRRVEIVAAMPRNAQGKILRREIARRLERDRSE